MLNAKFTAAAFAFAFLTALAVANAMKWTVEGFTWGVVALCVLCWGTAVFSRR